MVAHRYTQDEARAIAMRVFESHGPQVEAATLFQYALPQGTIMGSQDIAVYNENWELVAHEYDFLIRANTSGTEENAIARFADSVPATNAPPARPLAIFDPGFSGQPQMQGLTSERETMRPPALEVEEDEGPLDLEGTDSRAPFNPLDFTTEAAPQVNDSPHTPVVTNIEEAVVYEGQHPELGPTTFVIDPDRPLPGEEATAMSTRIFNKHDTGPSEEAQSPDRSTASEEREYIPVRGPGARRDGRVLAQMTERDEGEDDRGQSAFGDIFANNGGVGATISRIPSTVNAIEAAALKPGIKTTEGAIVAVAGLVLSAAMYFNWVTPAQATDWAQKVTNLLPLLVFLPVVWHFITSRGKIKSNALWAQATKEAAAGPMPQLQGLFGSKVDKILGQVGAGAAIGGALIPGKGGKVAGQVSDILSRVQESAPARKVTDDDIITALRELDERLYAIEHRR